jgi:hypothetical protein
LKKLKSKNTYSKVDANLTTKAYDLGKRILMTCNTSKFKPFNESEATQSVIENITEENLSKLVLTSDSDTVLLKILN